LKLAGFLERLGVGGPKTGLGQQSNTIKYVLIVAGPFYIVYFAFQYMIYLGFPDEINMMFLCMGMMAWGAGVYGFHSHKSKQCQEMLAFPQSKWRFDESTKTAIDLFIQKDGVRYIGKIEKKKLAEGFGDIIKQAREKLGLSHEELATRIGEAESLLVKVESEKTTPDDILTGKLEHVLKAVLLVPVPKGNPNPEASVDKHFYVVGPFPAPIGYAHPDLGLITFTRAYWILPETWKGTFEFLPGGEVWWDGIPVQHSNTENVSLHVKGWEDYMGEMIPVCQVCDSTWHYKHGTELLRSKWDVITDEEIDETKSMVLGKALLAKSLKLKTTEYHLDKSLEEHEDAEDVMDRRIGDFATRHDKVLASRPPLKMRLINMKTFAYVLVTIAVVGLLVWLFVYR